MANRYTVADNTWDGGGSFPVEGDRVLIKHRVDLPAGTTTWGDDATSTIVIDGTSTTKSINIASGGHLYFPRTASSELVCKGNVSVFAGGRYNQGTQADPIPVAYTARLSLNKSAALATNKYAFISEIGSYVSTWGSTKKRITTLTAGASAGATTIYVADATGWKPGDELYLPNTTTAGTVVTLTIDASYTPESLTVPITVALAIAYPIHCPAANITSNVTCGNFNDTYQSHFGMRTGAASVANSYELGYASFRLGGQVYPYQGSLSFYEDANYTATGHPNPFSAIESICSFNTAAIRAFMTVNFIGHASYTPINNSAFLVTTNANEPLTDNSGFEYNDCLMAGARYGGVFNGALGATFNRGWMTGQQYGSGRRYKFNDVKFMGYYRTGWYAATAPSGIGMQFTRCDFSETFALSAYTVFGQLQSTNTDLDFIFEDCYLGAATDPTDATLQNLTPSSSVKILNRDRDTTLHEEWYKLGYVKRDNSEVRRGTSSLKMKPSTASTAHTRSFKIPVVNGETVRIIGYCKYDTAYYNAGTGFVAPTMTLSGVINGVTLTPVVYTASSANADAWELIDKSITNSAGAAGSITVTYSMQSANVAGLVYWDGIANTPMVVSCRHYGYRFDEANPKRFVNTSISANEATAAAYTGITVTGATSAITLSSNRTFQILYDYTQAWGVLNQSSVVPITGSGVANSVSMTAVGNMTITGYTLNGGGSLSMGSNTLTATGYTYTGGTFSQATTVPSFSGGTLNIGAAWTYTFTQAASMTVSATPTSASTYDLSGSTFTGTLTFHNTTAHNIVVQIPAGVTANSTGSPGAGTVTFSAPAVARGLDFNGVLTGSTVKVFETGAQTVIATPTGPDWLWNESTAGSITVDYTIQLAGYLPIRVTGVTVTAAISGGVQTVTVQQVEASAYVASSGLTFDTNCFADPDIKLFGLTTASTLQNFYARMTESWITEPTLQNKPFPLVANGPNSFAFTDGWEWDLATYDQSINLLSRDGMKYKSSAGVTTAMWAAILTAGVPAGLQVRYQQSDGGDQGSAQNTGNMDQLLQIYGDATHGNFDRTDWLVLKVQEEGYDQAEAVHFSIYDQLDDQLYVYGLTPAANGVAAWGAADDASITITFEPTPVAWNGEDFSCTIEDTLDSRSGLEIMQIIRARELFNLHDMIRVNGSKFKTVNGNLYGDAYLTPAGVRVVKADGSTPHPDFDLFESDTVGTYYTPPVVAPITWAGALSGTTVLLYNDSDAGAIIDTQVVSGGGGYAWSITLPHADVAVGDSLRLRFGHKEYYAGELQGTMTASGLAFVGSMTLHPVYAGWGLDGEVYDQSYTPPGPFTMDGTNLQVDIAAGATTGTKVALGAWTQYLMTLPAGLDAFYGAWDLLALNQIRQNVAVVDVMIDVPTAGALFTFTDNNVNYYRSNFTFPGNVQAGHGLIAMTYNAEPFVATVTGGNVITGDPAAVAAAVRASLTTELSLLADMAALDGAVAGTDLVVTPTSRVAGTVSQTISDVGGTVTVSRT